MSPSSRSGGKFSLLCLAFLTYFHNSLSFANQSARFIFAYREGLSGAQAAWANKKYHCHRTLPPEWILTAKNLS